MLQKYFGSKKTLLSLSIVYIFTFDGLLAFEIWDKIIPIGNAEYPSVQWKLKDWCVVYA